MVNPVALPEKTLEHWASQYVVYRYRSHASLWWPTLGTDVEVRALPKLPGKFVELEMKTCRPPSPLSKYQDVSVNLGQLWDYTRRPFGTQPFYVFPWPTWRGNLEVAARKASKNPSDLAFSRSGTKWWFAEWMVVLTTSQVAAVLRTELAAHGSSTRKNAEARLVRFTVPMNSNGTTTAQWGPLGSVKAPTCIRWRDFWTQLENCGSQDWPQRVNLPSIPKDLGYSSVSSALRRLAVSSRERVAISTTPNDEGQARIVQSDRRQSQVETVTLIAGAEGTFQIEETQSKYDHSETQSNTDRRLAVFLDLARLFPNND